LSSCVRRKVMASASLLFTGLFIPATGVILASHSYSSVSWITTILLCSSGLHNYDPAAATSLLWSHWITSSRPGCSSHPAMVTITFRQK
jgi:hypothetical protein